MESVVNTHYAKTHLSALLSTVEAGGEVVIARNGKPVARMVPASKSNGRRQPGGWPLQIPDSFFEPMSEQELDALENGHPGDPLRPSMPQKSIGRKPNP